MSLAPRPRRETTLHLLFTRGPLPAVEAALHTLTTDQTSYYGANVLEAARAAGLSGTLLRRLHFRSQGEVNGVRRAETVWHLEASGHADLAWQPVSELPPPQRAWAGAALRLPQTPWMRPG